MDNKTRVKGLKRTGKHLHFRKVSFIFLNPQNVPAHTFFILSTVVILWQTALAVFSFELLEHAWFYLAIDYYLKITRSVSQKNSVMLLHELQFYDIFDKRKVKKTICL